MSNPSIKESPWLLTPAQADTMDAMCATGDRREAAKRLSIAHATLVEHLRNVREKMQVPKTLRALILWDRWRRPFKEQEHD